MEMYPCNLFQFFLSFKNVFFKMDSYVPLPKVKLTLSLHLAKSKEVRIALLGLHQARLCTDLRELLELHLEGPCLNLQKKRSKLKAPAVLWNFLKNRNACSYFWKGPCSNQILKRVSANQILKFRDKDQRERFTDYNN